MTPAAETTQATTTATAIVSLEDYSIVKRVKVGRIASNDKMFSNRNSSKELSDSREQRRSFINLKGRMIILKGIISYCLFALCKWLEKQLACISNYLSAPGSNKPEVDSHKEEPMGETLVGKIVETICVSPNGDKIVKWQVEGSTLQPTDMSPHDHATCTDNIAKESVWERQDENARVESRDSQRVNTGGSLEPSEVVSQPKETIDTNVYECVEDTLNAEETTDMNESECSKETSTYLSTCSDDEEAKVEKNGQPLASGSSQPEIVQPEPGTFSGNPKRLEKWICEMEEFLPEHTGDGDPIFGVDIAAEFFTGKAKAWWYVSRTAIGLNENIRDFNDFAELLWSIFGEYILSSEMEVRRKLNKLSHKHSVTKYAHAFKKLCQRLPDMGTSEQIKLFVRGLRKRTQEVVNLSIKSFKTLDEVIACAERVDRKIGISKNGNRKRNPTSQRHVTRLNEMEKRRALLLQTTEQRQHKKRQREQA